MNTGEYYKYPWRSATIILSAAWILVLIAIYFGYLEATVKEIAFTAILQAVALILFRLIDCGELVLDARARWKGP